MAKRKDVILSGTRYRSEPPEEVEIDSDPDSMFYQRPRAEPDDDFVASLRRMQLQPIVCQQVYRDDQSIAIKVIIGRRRVLGLRRINKDLAEKGEPLRLIDIKLENDWTEEQIRHAILAENAQRLDVDLVDKIEGAERYADLLRRQQAAKRRRDERAVVQAVALACRVSAADAERFLKVSRRPPEIQEAIFSERLPLRRVDDFDACLNASQELALLAKLEAPASTLNSNGAETPTGSDSQPNSGGSEDTDGSEQPNDGAPPTRPTATRVTAAQWHALHKRLSEEAGKHPPNSPVSIALLVCRFQRQEVSFDQLFVELGVAAPQEPVTKEQRAQAKEAEKEKREADRKARREAKEREKEEREKEERENRRAGGNTEKRQPRNTAHATGPLNLKTAEGRQALDESVHAALVEHGPLTCADLAKRLSYGAPQARASLARLIAGKHVTIAGDLYTAGAPLGPPAGDELQLDVLHWLHKKTAVRPSAADIAENVGEEPRKVAKALKRLIEDGHVRRTGSGKDAWYMAVPIDDNSAHDDNESIEDEDEDDHTETDGGDDDECDERKVEVDERQTDFEAYLTNVDEHA